MLRPVEASTSSTQSASSSYTTPLEAAALLARCESPAEAALLRALLARPDVRLALDGAISQGALVTVQHPVRMYRVDFALRAPGLAIAIEVDGVTYHSTAQPALARDYLRQRRITYAGYMVIRFTARDVFTDASRCWRQVAFIMEKSRRMRKRSFLRVLAAISGGFARSKPLAQP